ncbi:hypothetical protein [Stieleria maiorica]|uniref:hypothetical protein n=1 Tax=Stieleria maiorica TaxID=2795974 RepID=UPI0011C8EC3C|nr:hypothetical protein [Stieleria maiorica]
MVGTKGPDTERVATRNRKGNANHKDQQICLVDQVDLSICADECCEYSAAGVLVVSNGLSRTTRLAHQSLPHHGLADGDFHFPSRIQGNSVFFCVALEGHFDGRGWNWGDF